MYHRGRNKAFVYLTDASASFFFSGRHHPDRNNHSNCRHTLLGRTVFSLSTGLQNSAALVQLMACVFTAYEMSQLELPLKFCSIQHASKKGTNTKYFQSFRCERNDFMENIWSKLKHLNKKSMVCFIRFRCSPPFYWRPS